jgi:hypothetical protein
MRKLVPLRFISICLFLLSGCKKEEFKLDILKYD